MRENGRNSVRRSAGDRRVGPVSRIHPHQHHGLDPQPSRALRSPFGRQIGRDAIVRQTPTSTASKPTSLSRANSKTTGRTFLPRSSSTGRSRPAPQRSSRRSAGRTGGPMARHSGRQDDARSDRRGAADGARVDAEPSIDALGSPSCLLQGVVARSPKVDFKSLAKLARSGNRFECRIQKLKAAREYCLWRPLGSQTDVANWRSQVFVPMVCCRNEV